MGYKTPRWKPFLFLNVVERKNLTDNDISLLHYGIGSFNAILSPSIDILFASEEEWYHTSISSTLYYLFTTTHAFWWKKSMIDWWNDILQAPNKAW